MALEHEDVHTLSTSDDTDIGQREVPSLIANTLYIRNLLDDLSESVTIQSRHEPTSPRSAVWVELIDMESHDAEPIQEKNRSSVAARRVDEVVENSIFSWSHPWKHRVTMADSKEDVIALIRRFGLESTANRLTYLDGLAEDDSEEEHFVLESLRRFAVFVLDRHLPSPKIGISPGGLVHAVWWVPDGVLSMDFLPSGKVRFAAVLRDGEWSTRGVLPPYRMMEKIGLFKREIYR